MVDKFQPCSISQVNLVIIFSKNNEKRDNDHRQLTPSWPNKLNTGYSLKALYRHFQRIHTLEQYLWASWPRLRKQQISSKKNPSLQKINYLQKKLRPCTQRKSTFLKNSHPRTGPMSFAAKEKTKKKKEQ